MKNFYRDGGLVISIGALLTVTLVLAGTAYTLNSQIFWVFAPFIVLTAGFAVGKLIWVTRKTFQYFAVVNDEIDMANNVSLYNFPLSIAIIDKNRRFIWFNAGFVREFGDAAVFGNSLDAVTAASMESLFGGDGVKIKYADKHYKATATVPKENGAGEIVIIYFEDITREVALDTEKGLSQPVVMTIMIDSYEELLESDSENMSAAVTVQIDKLLDEYIRTTSGIIRKTGRDRFLAIIEERHVRQLIDGKVRLLDQAREIAVTDRINVTLSIGIGKTGRNLAESSVFARQALEMALGRGGDQAAIKTKSGFEFYGGVSKGVERHTKVRARVIANSLVDLADKSDIVYIMGHKFGDLDSIGSSVGIACGLRNLGKPAYVVVDKTASLGGRLIERVNGGGGDKAPLFITPQKANDAWTDSSLLIIVDTHNRNLLEDGELYRNAKKVVVIDHHRKMVDFIENAVIFHHEVNASSASEMVTELLQYFGDAGRITASQAEALLAGIMLDTKNFTIKTGVRTFEAAAFLRKLGADTVNVKTLFTNTIEKYKQKVALVGGAVIYKKCAIASTDIVSEDMRILAPQAADELLAITDVDASFLIYKTANGEINLSARSFGNMNVQIIAEALGGGGHQTMAGAQFKDMTVPEAEKLLREAIDGFYGDK
ncbi:MAG: DHH family phosphoesterase [Oscillospiraceae bacterium]|nr:DHH family phosphoesterase [Oscillospiraceae bacterium]